MSTLAPRAVVVTRPSDLDRFMARHATRGQAEFFLARRGQSLKELEHQDALLKAAILQARQAIPDDWSTVMVERQDLDRFLFTDRDIVVAIGQDGLVANLAKYLTGQPVIGVTPAASLGAGVLTTTPARRLKALLPQVAAADMVIEARTMVEARLDDGQSLIALNELFIGHRSHQSARYLMRADEQEEFQSSSGVIVSTGTGLTGWARSILTATHRAVSFSPEDRAAVYFTREPWPSRTTGCDLVFGAVQPDKGLAVVSRMNDGGVIFADGLEQDFLRFDWGVQASIGLAERTLNLVRTP